MKKKKIVMTEQQVARVLEKSKELASSSRDGDTMTKEEMAYAFCVGLSGKI